MWNWTWQDPRDYGERYDYGLLETHRRVIRQWREHNQAQPERGWLASKLFCNLADLKALPPGCVIIDQRQWIEHEGKACHGCGETGVWELTRGGVAACWAITHAPHGSTIVLVGFDVIRAGIALPVEDAFSRVYMDDPAFWGMGAYKVGKTKEGNHDYPAERRLLELLAARRGACRLVFAQDEWK